MSGTPVRPAAGKTALAFVAGLLLGGALVAPGIRGPLVPITVGEYGAVVGLAVLGLVAFTLVLWIVVVVYVVR